MRPKYSLRNVRDLLYGRDGIHCHECGRRVGLTVHHKKKVCELGLDESPYDPDNCVLLCKKCHAKIHDIDWRTMRSSR